MTILVGLIVVAWALGWVALVVYGLRALVKQYGVLGVLLGVLTVTLYPCIYGLNMIVAARFPSLSYIVRFAITICVILSFLGGTFLLLATCRARGLCS